MVIIGKKVSLIKVALEPGIDTNATEVTLKLVFQTADDVGELARMVRSDTGYCELELSWED
jgi:hypothetical protein